MGPVKEETMMESLHTTTAAYDQDQELARRGPIRAISRALVVLQAVNRAGPLTMKEIAVASGLPYPTVCRIVLTLVMEGMIEREPDRKCYRPTLRVQTLSAGYQSENRLVSSARQYLVELTDRFRWPIAVTSRIGTSMLIRDSTHAMTALAFNLYPPGYTLPMLESSSGRAYLAFCPDAERDSILHAIESSGTCLDGGPMRRNHAARILDDIRRQGFSTHERTMATANPGKTSSISAPVRIRGCVTGALTLIFFASAITMEEAIKQFAAPLKEAAAILSADLSEGQTH
jgi:IclR family mhp operon transcriptional activator